jgi:hypothetical protein
MLSCRLVTRCGATLIELIVAMVVGGVALALIATISVRQQRLYADIADRAALAGQLRQASTVLPIELRGASPVSGDIREARDTAIELRATIASAVVCDTAAGSVALAPSVAGAATLPATSPRSPRGHGVDSGAERLSRRSLPYAVSSTATLAPGSCAPLGPRLSCDGARDRSRFHSARVGAACRDVDRTALRVTRPVRYSLYRGGDGRWYLDNATERHVASLRRRFNRSAARSRRRRRVVWSFNSRIAPARRRRRRWPTRGQSRWFASMRARTIARYDAAFASGAQGKSSGLRTSRDLSRNRR